MVAKSVARLERQFRAVLGEDGQVVEVRGLVSPVRRRIHSYSRTRKNDRYSRSHANGWKGHKAAQQRRKGRS